MTKQKATATKKNDPANEFIKKEGVSAWDDIDDPADDEWQRQVRELLAKGNTESRAG